MSTDKAKKEEAKQQTTIKLPAGGVAIFGRTGTGKSSMFYRSRYVTQIIVADTGSMAHTMFHRGTCTVIDSTATDSPIHQVRKVIEHCKRTGELYCLDSFTTLQEQHVAWQKGNSSNARGPAVNLKDHQAIVGHLRDLALVLATTPGFTLFNVTPGGVGKTPSGEQIEFPAGAITGYPSLSGVGAGSESILSRWGCVWGVFPGHKETPRGLYVPGKDFRPAKYGDFSPLKDPYMVIQDTHKGDCAVMKAPDLRDPENAEVCFIDQIIEAIQLKLGGR